MTAKKLVKPTQTLRGLLGSWLAARKVAPSTGDFAPDTSARSGVARCDDILSLLLNEHVAQGCDWLWETASDGRIIRASRGLAAGLGVDPEHLIGRNFDSLVSAPDEAEGWHELLAAMLRRKPVEAVQVKLPFVNGRTRWRITALPGFDTDRNFQGYRGVARDMTEEYRVSQDLIRAKEAAERSSASKSQFLAVMSHELRTPLNAIVGFSELLTSPVADAISEDVRGEHLRTILASSRHLQSLINDILDASRIDKGTMQLAEQDADAAELTEVAVKMCRDAAEKSDVTIIARIQEGIDLRCDITRIKQVLINLITNAVKFSPPGGYVNLGFERTVDGGLAFVVRDAGVGIASRDLERIFEPYVQADQGTARRFGGVGLGLAIARSIAVLHGGNVTIESQPGMGSTARLLLPARRVSWSNEKTAGTDRAA